MHWRFLLETIQERISGNESRDHGFEDMHSHFCKLSTLHLLSENAIKNLLPLSSHHHSTAGRKRESASPKTKMERKEEGENGRREELDRGA